MTIIVSVVGVGEKDHMLVYSDRASGNSGRDPDMIVGREPL